MERENTESNNMVEGLYMNWGNKEELESGHKTQLTNLRLIISDNEILKPKKSNSHLPSQA